MTEWNQEEESRGPSGAIESPRSTSSTTYCATYTDDDVQSVTNATSMSLKGNLAENWTFFKESWESYKIATELGKKPKQVILETLLKDSSGKRNLPNS